MNVPVNALALFLLMPVVGVRTAVRPTAQQAEQSQPPKKGAPSFTDEDLARYREERLREESDGASPAAGVPAAAPTDPAMAERSALPMSLPGGFSVVLQDLNGTLPPAVREEAESVARRFVTFFEVPVEGRLVIPLRYFPRPDEYRQYAVRNLQDDNVTWIGYHDPAKGEIVVRGGEDYVAVLLHEINHFIVDKAFEEAPTWLDEGLAEYFQASSAEGERLMVKVDTHHRRHLAQWLAQGRRPGLRQLLGPAGWTALDHGREHDHVVRSLAWSLVDFLMRDAEGREILRAMMARLKGYRGLHSLEAVDRTFPGGAGAFERQWIEHIETRVRAP